MANGQKSQLSNAATSNTEMPDLPCLTLCLTPPSSDISVEDLLTYDELRDSWKPRTLDIGTEFDQRDSLSVTPTSESSFSSEMIRYAVNRGPHAPPYRQSTIKAASANLVLSQPAVVGTVLSVTEHAPFPEPFKFLYKLQCRLEGCRHLQHQMVLDTGSEITWALGDGFWRDESHREMEHHGAWSITYGDKAVHEGVYVPSRITLLGEAVGSGRPEDTDFILGVTNTRDILFPASSGTAWGLIGLGPGKITLNNFQTADSITTNFLNRGTMNNADRVHGKDYKHFSLKLRGDGITNSYLVLGGHLGTSESLKRSWFPVAVTHDSKWWFWADVALKINHEEAFELERCLVYVDSGCNVSYLPTEGLNNEKFYQYLCDREGHPLSNTIKRWCFIRSRAHESFQTCQLVLKRPGSTHCVTLTLPRTTWQFKPPDYRSGLHTSPFQPHDRYYDNNKPIVTLGLSVLTHIHAHFIFQEGLAKGKYIYLENGDETSTGTVPDIFDQPPTVTTPDLNRTPTEHWFGLPQ